MTEVGGGTRTGSPDEGLMLTTKGDIHSFDVEDKRLPVGPDGQILTADSLQALGVKWAAPAVGFNLTTKGDIHTFDTDQNRLEVGTNGQVLTADSVQPLGIKWADPAAEVGLDLTTKGDIHGFDTVQNRVPIGTDGQVLTADAAQALGLKWADPVSGEVFTWTNDHDAASNSLLNVASIESDFATPATSGFLRLGSQEQINWRNAANNANLSLFADANDLLRWDGSGIQLASKPIQTVSFITNIPGQLADAGFLRQGNVGNDTTALAWRNAANTNNLTLNAVPPDEFQFTFSGTLEYVLSATKLDIDAKFIEIESIASPGVTGSATTGRIFMDPANSEHLSIIRNAGIIDLEGAGGGDPQTPIAQDIQYAGFDIKDISNVEFRNTTGAPGGTVRAIYADAGGMIFNVATATNFDFQSNGVSFLTFESSANGITLGTNIDLRVGDNDVTFDSINVSIFSTAGRMFFDVTDNSDDYNWRFANTTRMVMNTTKLDIQDKFLELESIASPGVTGSATVGRLFMDSGNSNRLSTIRNGVVFDLETGLEITLWTVDHSMGTSKLTATAANNVILNAPTGQAVSIEVAAAQEYSFGATTANFLGNVLTNVSRYETNATTLPSFGEFRLGNQELIVWKSIGSGEVSLKVDGTDQFNFAIGGQLKLLISTTQVQTNNSNLNMGSGLLQGGSGTDTLQWVAGNLIIDVAATFDFQLRVDNATEYNFSATSADFLGNNLILGLGIIQFENANQTIGDSGFSDLQYDVSIGNLHLFRINDSIIVKIGEDALDLNTLPIRWAQDGHQITPAATSLTYDLGAATDQHIFQSNSVTIFTITNVSVTFADAVNMVVNATTGTKIATATSQKIAFWNATPIVQPAHIADPSGGATVDAEARTAIAAINALLASTGLSAAA